LRGRGQRGKDKQPKQGIKWNRGKTPDARFPELIRKRGCGAVSLSRIMVRRPGIHICVFILVALSGCDRLHRRPSVVPRSAVWIDHTFIDCSAEKQSKGNACTVYKDDTGEILADGLFLLNYPARAASEPELRHYAAYGDHTIFLEDAKLLMQKSATRRDPSEQVIRQRLETLASRDATSAIDCNEPGERIAKCATDAFAAKKAVFCPLVSAISRRI
jgi:hypothetical protein